MRSLNSKSENVRISCFIDGHYVCKNLEDSADYTQHNESAYFCVLSRNSDPIPISKRFHTKQEHYFMRKILIGTHSEPFQMNSTTKHYSIYSEFRFFIVCLIKRLLQIFRIFIFEIFLFITLMG